MENRPGLENENFIEQLRNGDEKTFEKVITMYQKIIFKIAYGYTNDFHLADDITQETFITLYKNVKKISSAEHLKYFIYKAAVSRSLDFLRRNRIKKLFMPFSQADDAGLVNLADAGDDQETIVIKDEFQMKLQSALKDLSGHQKAVFILKNHEGLTIKEIGRITGMSESTVKTHFFRAMKSIRKHLERCYEK